MKAMVNTEYGLPDVIHHMEVEKPTPKADQVLIRVEATGLNMADWYMLTGKPFFVRLMAGGIRRPKLLIRGADVAGRVEAVGANVTQFKVGDEVFGDVSGCGWGGLAEYVAVPESVLVSKPATITFEQAAAAPMAAVTALQGLRDKGQIRAGQRVLINGASGGVGTFAVQIAKSFGTEVTAVCSTRKIEMVRSIGADHVIDYTKENFTRSGRQYDLILAANGQHTLSEYKRVLTPEGICVCSGGTMSQVFEVMLLGPLMSMTSKQKTLSLMAGPNQADLACIANLLEAGKIVPVIDRCYPLDEAAAAMRYLGDGHATGKVVISLTDGV